MQFYRKTNVKKNFAAELEAMIKKKNEELGVYRKRDIKHEVDQHILKENIKRNNQIKEKK